MTRADLSPGQRVVQAAHAVADFCATVHADRWRSMSNSIVTLCAPDERALFELCSKARAAGVDVTCFEEPDLCFELTAAAFAPSAVTRRMLSSLPLASRDADNLVQVDASKLRERRLRELSVQMSSCEQAPGLSVLEHGVAVRDRFDRLVALLDALDGTSSCDPAWKLPDWMFGYASQLVAEVSPRLFDVRRYLCVHDCGKPSCVRVDADGRRHFPGHAERSADVWLELTDPKWAFAKQSGFAPFVADAVGVPDSDVSRWIRRDMDVHMLSGADVAAFAADDDCVVLLLAGFAELHANADMFGGFDATSFKIKWKHLDRRGRAICKARFGDLPSR